MVQTGIRRRDFMVDWEKLQKMARQETQLEIMLKEKLTGMLPVIISISILIYIYLWVMENYGFERPVISLLVIIVVLLNAILRAVESGKTE